MKKAIAALLALSMRSQFVVFGFLIVAAVSAAAACSGGRVDGAAASARAADKGGGGSAVPIEVARAVRKNMPVSLTAIGGVEASSTVAVRAQITGQLTTVHFKEGDDVKAGSTLFTLDRRPFEAALQQAQANLQRDTALAANARVLAQRYADLSTRGIATREQVETSRANAEALTGTIAADEAAVENARIQLQYATITSPLSGRTGALMVHEGNLVRANDATPLVVINQLSPVNVAFAIPESQLAALKRYMAQREVPVTVLPPDESATPSTGRVTFVDNMVDQTTGTIRVKASFPNGDRRLWPGQYVNVTLTLATDVDAIVVPSVAVQAGQQGSYVLVVSGGGTADLRPVKVRRTSGDETIIESGLGADDVVVTDGHLRLVPGGRVSIKGGSAQQARP
jgi:multidrug efflux system membrane fusion protein